MITIEALLQRIRWDPAFGRGRFTIGYFDRVERRVVTVPLEQIRIERGNHFSFTAVEADGSVHDVPFHRVRAVHRDGLPIWQRRETFARWRAETPPEFRFAIKANRYLTHSRRLIDPLPSIRLERDRAAGLGHKLAAVLWQLPASFHVDIDRLRRFASALRCWRTVRHAIEFRHPSWFVDEVADCLCEHRIAACRSDAADWPSWNAVTTDLVYVRLHGHTITYASGYPAPALAAWAARVRHWLAEGRSVHVYFDNDALGHAPADAMRLLRRLGAAAPHDPARARRRTS